ncbi:MAG: MarR family transcriptional regulator [Gammaproteobacteria bacterium]|nr:MarR family transcriptional regulator [Gammaproteobacteria bacterium]
MLFAVRLEASINALASALEVQPMSVLRTVDGLEQRKMLRRETDPAECRALQLFLTKAPVVLGSSSRYWR